MSISTAHSIVGYRPEDRPVDDFYPTPPEAVEALLRAERFEGRIWEPACGNGSISKVLESAGFSVVSTDLNNRGFGITGVDFLTTRESFAGTIITNPPFVLAEEFIEHAVYLKVQKMALLLKLSALEGSRRSALLRKTRLKKVYVFENRLSMTRNGEPMKNGGMITFAWFVWERGYSGMPEIGWLRWKNPGQKDLFDFAGAK